MRVVNIAFFLVLLLALTASTVLYLYEKTEAFPRWIGDLTFIRQALDKVQQLAADYKFDPRWGIGGVLLVIAGLFFFYRCRKKMPKAPSHATVFFVTLVLVLGIGGLTSIYYWPQDTVRFGPLFTIHRGTQQEYLHNMELIGVVVVAVHLFFFLLLNLVRWTWYEEKREKKEKK